ncbi:MAG: hypothetical protein CMB22_00245 [Euryarchaeota archaeon]|nr:hypothetical protein [Euryarchaeota archaeon]|tara:strand:- start:2355 stop:3110 length:756 start_codon:yes stop_codon:yes gene_type:complete
MAKILFFDIETAPNLSYIWGQWQQDAIEHVREWYILCFSYKWEHQKRTNVVSLDDFEMYKEHPEDDFAVVHQLWKLLDEADIVIGHNSDAFDIKKANARFAYHNMGPTSHYQTVDTLKLARRHFKFNSNRLGHLGEHLGLGSKEATGGFQTWEGCMRGDTKAWGLMKKYAKQDVDLLVDVYERLRPWATTHPNRNVIDSTSHGCPTCGSNKLQKRGKRTTRTMIYQTYQCTRCRSYCRSRVADEITRPEVV